MHAEMVKECGKLGLSWLLEICMKTWSERPVTEDLQRVVIVLCNFYLLALNIFFLIRDRKIGKKKENWGKVMFKIFSTQHKKW